MAINGAGCWCHHQPNVRVSPSECAHPQMIMHRHRKLASHNVVTSQVFNNMRQFHNDLPSLKVTGYHLMFTGILIDCGNRHRMDVGHIWMMISPIFHWNNVTGLYKVSGQITYHQWTLKFDRERKRDIGEIISGLIPSERLIWYPLFSIAVSLASRCYSQ